MIEKNLIRQCNKDDFNGVFELLKQLWPKREFIKKDLQKTFLNALSSTNQHYFCATINDEIIGFGSFNIKNGLYANGKVAILDELIVDENYRKLGIAKKLVDFMVGFAKKNKCVCIELECGKQRKDAHKFYEKYGLGKGIGCFFSMDLN